MSITKNKLKIKKQQIVLVAFDLFVSILVYFVISYLYLYKIGHKLSYDSMIIHGIVYCIIIIALRIIFLVYKQVWRYVEINSFLKLIKADFVSCALFIIVDRYCIKNILQLTITDSISLFLLNLLLTIIIRIVYYYIFILSRNNNIFGKICTLILKIFISKDDLEYNNIIFEDNMYDFNKPILVKSPLILMYITNDVKVAEIAEQYGVDRIWIDLEYKGKEIRQHGRNAVLSKHTINDIKKMAPVLKKAKLLVRINPWDENSINEVNDVIDAGAELIMLPMWKTVNEVKSFINVVSGRAKTILLLETKEAKECLDEVLELKGIDEIHIGLNDLHLSYGLTFMFEPLANGMIEEICEKIKSKRIPYGFGGIAKIGTGALPAENIIIEHYRLGSTRAILSRAFCDTKKITDYGEIEKLFRDNMKKLYAFENYAANANEKDYKQNQKIVKNRVAHIVRIIKEVENNE